MIVVEYEEKTQAKYAVVRPVLNEKARRYWAASEAQAIGRGGVAIIARSTGMSRTTIYAGLNEIGTGGDTTVTVRIRRPGGGRRSLRATQPETLDDLRKLVEPTERGDPVSPLRWTTKSTTHLADQLRGQGHAISQPSVYRFLRDTGYSLQSNRKTRDGASHPDRDAQFRYINESVEDMQKKNQPVISVDTKKKELVGNFKQNGCEWKPKRQPTEVRMHDFADRELGKVIPYGVYDLSSNEGWVNIGITHDTAQFAVASIRRWWHEMGAERYSHATELLITADSGGSNARRSRLWKIELQRLANELMMTIRVRHFPPGTSKWNKIEHRMFSFISKNWRGRPLIDRATVVNLIANTKTKMGLLIRAVLDEHTYETGKKISNAELSAVNLTPDAFHGEWNYSIAPRG